MEKEIKFDDNRKKLISAFRSLVANGKSGSRSTLLAYAFLRGRKYATLEEKINEDHPSFGEGKWSFLTTLLWEVARDIDKVVSKAELEGYTAPTFKEIYAWFKEKYEQPQVKVEEKAA